jgi:hypothetical protein
MSENPTSRALRVVPPPEPVTLAERIANLQAELRAANAEQFHALRYALETLVAMAQAVAENPSQPAGRREIARALAEHGEGAHKTLAAIQDRTP